MKPPTNFRTNVVALRKSVFSSEAYAAAGCVAIFRLNDRRRTQKRAIHMGNGICQRSVKKKKAVIDTAARTGINGRSITSQCHSKHRRQTMADVYVLAYGTVTPIAQSRRLILTPIRQRPILPRTVQPPVESHRPRAHCAAALFSV